MFQRLWTDEGEGGVLFLMAWHPGPSHCSGRLGELKNWLTKECGSLQIHKFDNSAYNADSRTRSVTDG